MPRAVNSNPWRYDIGQIVAGFIRAPRSAAVFQTSWRKRHESPSAEQNIEDARLCLDERGVSPAISATCRAGLLLSPPALAKKAIMPLYRLFLISDSMCGFRGPET
jgi:hypothetical protein